MAGRRVGLRATQAPSSLYRALLAAAVLVSVEPVGDVLWDPAVLDLSYHGDIKREGTADVIKGLLRIHAPIIRNHLKRLELKIGYMLAGLCETNFRVPVRIYEELVNFQVGTRKLICLYYLLPVYKFSPGCTWGLRNPTFIVDLLQWTVQLDDDLDWDVRTWGLQIESVTVQRRGVKYSIDRSLPNLTDGHSSWPQAGTGDHGVGDQFSTATSCKTWNSACLCAASNNCTWALSSSGGFQCTEGSAMVTCEHCPFQTQCPDSRKRVCELQSDPCSCVHLGNRCYWDLSTMRCRVNTGQALSTSCQLCVRQDGCDPPRLSHVSPAADTIFGPRGAKRLEVTFDRTVHLHSTQDDVCLQCDSGPPRSVPPGLVTVSDRRLFVELGSLTSSALSNCQLMLAEGLVHDSDGLDFLGEGLGWYTFRLEDSVAPVISEFRPKNGASDVTPLIANVTLAFNEPVVLQPRCEMMLSAKWMPVAAFRLDVPEVQLSPDRQHLSLALGARMERGVTYSLTLPMDCIWDDAHNAFSGLAEGSYFFRTEATVINGTVEKNHYPPVFICVATGVAGLVVLVAAIILRLKLRGARKHLSEELDHERLRRKRGRSSSLTGLGSIVKDGKSPMRQFSLDSFAMGPSTSDTTTNSAKKQHQVYPQPEAPPPTPSSTATTRFSSYLHSWFCRSAQHSQQQPQTAWHPSGKDCRWSVGESPVAVAVASCTKTGVPRDPPQTRVARSP